MAFSAVEGKEFFREWFTLFAMYGENAIRRVLDIGAGAGAYADIIKRIDPSVEVDGVEIYEPYINRFSLKEKYNRIFIGDVVEMSLFDYDLIVMGDVLEHIPKQTAVEFFHNLKKKAKFIWLCVPVRQFRPWFWGYNQPEADFAENIAEKHMHEWGYDEVLSELGPFLWQIPFRTVAVFIAEGVSYVR
jgi:2-polyprenyl-3-methyl-5-hydroxy-6-metoxy-1,4-benzoquinol methylase